MSIQESEPIGALCSQHPLAAWVLHHHGVDAPDPGRSLDGCCRDRGVDPEAVRGALRREEEQLTAPWHVRPLGELIDHVLRTYHRPFDAEVAGTAAAIEAARPPETEPGFAGWAELGGLLEELRADMQQHMAKEERVLFPWLRRGAATAGAPIRAMQLEHGDTIQLLHGIHAAIRRWLPAGPRDAHETAAVTSIASLERRLGEHMHLESNLLFARALDGPEP
jgi:regulator of cell morphogenesis and NO signaling